MATTIACPFCKTTLETPPGKIAICPRCGETFAISMADKATESPTAPVVAGQPRWFKPAVLLSCVASVIIVIVGATLIFTNRTATTTPTTARTPGILPPPVSLGGLAYLPAQTQVIAGFSPGPLQIYAEVNNTDPLKILADAGVPKTAVDTLLKFGIPLKQIDHVVVGLVLPDDSAIPQVTLVLVLKDALVDEGPFWKNLGAERVSGGDRPKYKATVGGLPVQAMRVTPTVYVLATEVSVISKLDGAKPGSVDSLPPSLKETLTTKLSPASFVWLATATKDNWVKTPAIQLLANFTTRKDLLESLASGRAMAMGLALEPDPWLRLAVKVDSKPTAMVVGDWFGTKLPGEFTEVTVGDNDWAEVKLPCPVADIGGMLKKLMPVVK